MACHFQFEGGSDGNLHEEGGAAAAAAAAAGLQMQATTFPK